MIDDRRIGNNNKAPHGRDSQAAFPCPGPIGADLFGPPADSKNACASFCVWKSEQSIRIQQSFFVFEDFLFFRTPIFSYQNQIPSQKVIATMSVDDEDFGNFRLL